MLFLKECDPQAAVFEDLHGRPHQLAVADLLELATEGRDAQTGQRLPGFAERFAAARITGAEECAGGWRFTLADRRTFTVESDALADACEPQLWQVPRACWAVEDAVRLPVHDFAKVLSEDGALRQCLLTVARHGFTRLEGAAAQGGEVERLVARFGTIRETNYGRIFDVIANPSPNNLADTAMRLAPHTDNPYRASPPDIQILHCLEAADSGGDTLLVDGLAVAEQLRTEAPEAFEQLARVPVQFAWSDGKTRLTASRAVIELDAHGEIIRLRCNDRARRTILAGDPGQRQAWREAYAKLCALIEGSAFAFRLAPGDLLFIDNRRVLHGRSEFAQHGARRHLQGAYADVDGLFSTLFHLTAHQAAQELSQLAELFDSAAMSEPYGEELSIRDHMLQSAELAVERRLGGAMVTAALLHDVGWALDGAREHQHVAADLLAPLFGPGIADLVRHHVAAKRYLVASQPDYEACLSDESRRTLARQGGPMAAAERAQFASEPCFQTALQLRCIDDGGKDLRSPASSFATYAPVLHRQLIRFMLGQ